MSLVWLSTWLQHLTCALCMRLFIMCVRSDPALCNEHCHGMVYGCIIHPMALSFHQQRGLPFESTGLVVLRAWPLVCDPSVCPLK